MRSRRGIIAGLAGGGLGMAVSDKTLQWLRDAPAASAEALAALNAPPNPLPPDPLPPNPEGDMLTMIKNEDDLRSAMQAASQGTRIVVDPSSPPVTVTKKIVVPVTKTNFYFDGSGLQVATNIPGWDHLFEFQDGREGFRLKNLFVTGSYPNRECGDAFRFMSSNQGNNESFYNFSIQGLRVEHISGNAYHFMGAFEGSVDMIETNDVGGSGVVFENGPTGGGTTTQITVNNAQLSRCDKWGAEQLASSDQVTWISPKFVCNGMGGIHATNGIHYILNPQMENAGEIMVVVDSQSWAGAEIASPQLASDGAWVRNWVNPHTGPTRYIVKCPAGAVAVTGVPKLRGYGGSATQQGWLQVYYPGSQKAGVESETYPSVPLSRDAAKQQARPMEVEEKPRQARRT
jgi:hypothetical protein